MEQSCSCCLDTWRGWLSGPHLFHHPCTPEQHLGDPPETLAACHQQKAAAPKWAAASAQLKDQRAKAAPLPWGWAALAAPVPCMSQHSQQLTAGLESKPWDWHCCHYLLKSSMSTHLGVLLASFSEWSEHFPIPYVRHSVLLVKQCVAPGPQQLPSIGLVKGVHLSAAEGSTFMIVKSTLCEGVQGPSINVYSQGSLALAHRK